MTTLSKKCQYALRTVLELTRRRNSDRPTSVNEIAAAQAIPRRFLELIIKELKHAGIVQAHRGARGGYTLVSDPKAVTIGQIVRLIQGELNLVDCHACGGDLDCSLGDDCTFADVWSRADQAVADVLDTTTFESLAAGKNAKAEFSI